MPCTRMLYAVAVLAASHFALPVSAEAQQMQPATVLVIVDDLHLDFRATPRLRELAGQIVQSLVREGKPLGLISTGASGVSVPPTTERATLDQAITRLVGNALKLSEALDERETRARATTVFSTAAEAIDAAAARGGQSLAVLYVSGGYDDGLVFEADRLVTSARRAKVALNTIDLPAFVSASAPQGIAQADWDARVAVRQGSLSALASQTQGTASFTAADVNLLLARVTSPGR